MSKNVFIILNNSLITLNKVTQFSLFLVKLSLLLIRNYLKQIVRVLANANRLD